MLTVYAQKISNGVQIWRDANKNALFCQLSKHHHAKMPDKRNKQITLNCYRWNLVWL